jgi:hypothetical protein
MISTTSWTRLAALCGLVMSYACGGEALVPTIDTYSPASGLVGAQITIQGRHFDRDAAGYPAESASRPWQVYLLGADRRYELTVVDATDHSLVVVVPEGAKSGALALADVDGVISEAARFTVLERPVVRVYNEAQYDVVDLRLNGEQVLTDGRVLESGAVMLVAADNARYRVDYGVGELKDAWVRGTIHGLEVGEPGSEAMLRIPTLNPIDMLAVQHGTTDWVAELRDLAQRPMTITLRFYPDGTWARLLGDAPQEGGTLAAERVPPYARSLPFRLGEGGPAAKFSPPFLSFDLENGPPHWPLLRYVRTP